MSFIARSATLLLFLGSAFELSGQNTFPSSGNAGIGTASPGTALDIVAATNITKGILKIKSSDSNSAGLTFWTGGNSAMRNWQIASNYYSNGGLSIMRSTSNSGDPTTSVVELDASGNLSIGSTAAASKVTISGTVSGAGNRPASGLTFLSPNNAHVFGQIGLVQNTSEGDHYLLIQSVEDTVAWRPVVLARDGGNVGIGTSTPAAPLNVVGNVAREVARFQGSVDVSNNRNFFSLFTTNPGHWWEFSNQDPAGGGSLNGLAFRERSGSGTSIERVYFATGGNVGIGTTTPSHKLAVNGTIRAKEVIVDTGWSDYVFADDYRLAPLAEVESHIKAEQHLPGIPSAQEVAEHGVSMGEMQSKLLAKIEELTLHQIAQEKNQAAQEKRLNQQAALLTEQSDRLQSLEQENATLRRTR